MWLDDHLTIRLDRYTPVATRILLEVPPPSDPELQLSGRIMGPFSRYARTLPATLHFRGEPTSHGLRATTQFPDFCGWSAEHPQLYRVTAELSRQEIVEQRVERKWGTPLLSIRRKSFYWEGRRWVMRAIQPSDADPFEMERVRELDATLICREPTGEDCRQADELGIRLVARLTLAHGRDSREISTRLEQLERHPSVILAWLEMSPADADWPVTLSKPPRLLVAADIRLEGRHLLPPWTDIGICRREQLDRGLAPAAIDKPLLVCETEFETDPAVLRRGCDRLQAAVARQGEFAGFLATCASRNG
jgi:hypothetical protein